MTKMDIIEEFKDTEYKEKLKKLNNKFNKLSKEQFQIISLIYYRYKKHKPKKYFLYFSLIYWLYFFKLLNSNDKSLSLTDRKYLNQFELIFKNEQLGDCQKYINSFFELPEWLRALKIIIKYTVLNNTVYLGLIPNYKNYLKSIWWILPWISFKKYNKIESLFQHFYFRELYKEKYYEAKEQYWLQLENVKNIDDLLVKLWNSITFILKLSKVFAYTTVRKKSIFSFYNKILRKGKNYQMLDFIWARLLFKNEKDIYKFLDEVKWIYKIENEKDYLTKRKENWYQSYHCTVYYTFEDKMFPIEFQLRTIKQEDKIKNWDISHFNYSLNNNKWDKQFIEIWKWIKYLKEKNIFN